MCTLIAAIGEVPGFPLVLAGNRDEDPARNGSLPDIVCRSPRIWAGLDPKAGGTWLGLNEHGVVVALTDRSTPEPNPDLRSRGLLCLDGLRLPNARSAMSFVGAECARRAFNYFNIFCADREEARVLYYTGHARVRRVGPGLHVLGRRDVDDPITPKVARARSLIRQEPKPVSIADWIERLKAVCADEDPSCEPGDRIQVRAERISTLCSSIIALHESALAKSIYLHCQGLPGEVPYEDFSRLLS